MWFMPMFSKQGAFQALLMSYVVIAGSTPKSKATCRICGEGARIERVALPYVFRYLLAELAVMNIKLSLTMQ